MVDGDGLETVVRKYRGFESSLSAKKSQKYPKSMVKLLFGYFFIVSRA